MTMLFLQILYLFSVFIIKFPLKLPQRFLFLFFVKSSYLCHIDPPFDPFWIFFCDYFICKDQKSWQKENLHMGRFYSFCQFKTSSDTLLLDCLSRHLSSLFFLMILIENARKDYAILFCDYIMQTTPGFFKTSRTFSIYNCNFAWLWILLAELPLDMMR